MDKTGRDLEKKISPKKTKSKTKVKEEINPKGQKRDKNGLTPRQKLFADYYLENPIAEVAARKAGYSEAVVKADAYKLLGYPGVKAYIDERNRLVDNKKIASLAEIKEFWTNMVRMEEKGVIESKDRLKASEYIAKTYGAFLDKVEHSGEMQLALNIKTSDLKDEDEEINDFYED